MKRLTRLRERLNHDADGSLRGRNRRLGALETAGLLLLVAALLLWLFRAGLAIGAAWPLGVGAAGLLLARMGNRHPDAPVASAQQQRTFSTRSYRTIQALAGLLFIGIGLVALFDAPPDALALVAATVFLVLGGNALHATWRGRQSWLFALGSIF